MENQPIYPQNLKAKASHVGERQQKTIEPERLRKVCSDFEAVLIAQLLKSMRQSLTHSGFGGNGLGREIYESIFDQELSRIIARGKGLGIGKIIYEHVRSRVDAKDADLTKEVGSTIRHSKNFGRTYGGKPHEIDRR